MKTPVRRSVPGIPLELVLELDRRWPNEIPKKGDPQAVSRRQGAREVIDFLIREAEAQHNVKLETTRVFRTDTKAGPAGGPSATPAGP